jgi:hypothetical protein
VVPMMTQDKNEPGRGKINFRSQGILALEGHSKFRWDFHEGRIQPSIRNQRSFGEVLPRKDAKKSSESFQYTMCYKAMIKIHK